MRAPVIKAVEHFWYRNGFLIQNIGFLVLVYASVREFVS